MPVIDADELASTVLEITWFVVLPVDFVNTAVSFNRAVKTFGKCFLDFSFGNICATSDLLAEVLLMRVVVGRTPDQRPGRPLLLTLHTNTPVLLRAAEKLAKLRGGK